MCTQVSAASWSWLPGRGATGAGTPTARADPSACSPLPERQRTTRGKCLLHVDSKIWDKSGEAGGSSWSLHGADVPPLWHPASRGPSS